jgi:hypothetical protein
LTEFARYGLMGWRCASSEKSIRLSNPRNFQVEHMFRAILLATAVVLTVSLPNLGAAADPVREKLDKAKAAYAEEMSAYREKAQAWFESREDVARKAGNKKLVDQIKEESATFERTDDLPAKAPRDLKQRATNAQARVVRVYQEAVKDFVRAKQDKEAEATEKELELVKLGVDPSDNRRRWVHERGEFRIVKRGEWEEITPEGARHRWLEVNRTKKYVELSIFFGRTKHFARLEEGTDGRRKDGDVDWKPLFLGKWAE